MIVACERCQTRFQLEDARVPDTGIRVRCSRCKHAFVVHREGHGPEHAVHAVAAEAARLERTGPPPATVDLATSPPAAASAGISSSEEEDWTFNESPPEAERAAPEPRRPRRSARADEPRFADSPSEPAAGEALEVVGSPESWDFGLAGPRPADGSVQSEPVEAPPAPPACPTAQPVPPAASERSVAEHDAALTSAREMAATGGALSSSRPRDGDTIRWGAAALLLLLVAVVSLAPRSNPPASWRVPAAPVGALTLDDARLRLVDNAVAGPLLVVSGSLRNPGAGVVTPGAAIELVLSDGTPGARAVAGLAPAEERLRLDSPEALRAAIEASSAVLAARSVAPGDAIPVLAVFASLPRALPEGGRGVRVATRPVPAPAGEASSGAAGPADEATAGASLP